MSDFNAALRLDARYAPAYVERGGEWLRRGDIDKGFSDYVEGVRRQPKRIDDVLAFVERRAADLAKDDRDETAVEVCRRALALAAPLFAERIEVKKIIDDGLAAAKAEPNMHQRGALLRETILRLRGRLLTMP